MAGAVIASLQKHGLKPIPVSGQDATPQGFQNIISGWQTMTVWKDTRILAKVTAQAAVTLINRHTPKTTGNYPNRAATEPPHPPPPDPPHRPNLTVIHTSKSPNNTNPRTRT